MADFDLQPTLSDPLLLLRPAQEADWDALYAVASDPLIWALHPVSDRYQEPVFRAFFDSGLACGGMLVAIDQATGAIIGSSRFDRRDVARDAIEIGWTFLARSHWGGAYNRSMKRMMLRHAFRFISSVDFNIGEHNLRSRGAMEKIGGILSDRTEDVVVNGVTIRHLIYEISRSGFEASPLACD